MCPCPVPLVNTWYRGGRVVETREVTQDPAQVDRDAADYVAAGVGGWEIGCPDCGLVYAAGVTS